MARTTLLFRLTPRWLRIRKARQAALRADIAGLRLEMKHLHTLIRLERKHRKYELDKKIDKMGQR